MNDIIGARYWYKPTKQYGYELVSFRIVKFRDGETRQPFYMPYVNVLLEKSKLHSEREYPSVEGYPDEDFFMERWTGAEDSDGVKIYEGDIVEVVYDTLEQIDVREVGVIRYGKPYPDDWLDEFYLEEEDDKTPFSSFPYLINNDNLLVLGNVNENPEMYEKFKKGES